MSVVFQAEDFTLSSSTTQTKLFFAAGDDGDAASDQVQIATGNCGATSPGRPRLVVTYEYCLN